MIYETMLKLCDDEHIIVSYENFKPPLNGLYLSCDGLHAIMLATSIRDNHPLRNVVFAEELGHHFTLAGNNLPQEHWNRLHRCNFTKDEARAIRWAAEYLIPYDQLMQAGYEDITTIPALAEYFEVTPNFIAYRLTLPDMQKMRYREIV